MVLQLINYIKVMICIAYLLQVYRPVYLHKKKKLAQLVEHLFYTQRVKCSNHLFIITYLLLLSKTNKHIYKYPSLMVKNYFIQKNILIIFKITFILKNILI